MPLFVRFTMISALSAGTKLWTNDQFLAPRLLVSSFLQRADKNRLGVFSAEEYLNQHLNLHAGDVQLVVTSTVEDRKSNLTVLFCLWQTPMLAIAHMSTQKQNIIKDYPRHHSSFNPTTTLITLLYKNSYTVLVMLLLKESRSFFAESTT